MSANPCLSTYPLAPRTEVWSFTCTRGAESLLLLGAVVCEINTAYRSCALATNGVKMQAGKSLFQTHIFVRLKRSCFSPRILKQQAVGL